MPRSLPLLPPVVDRGRAKTRINSEPDTIHTLSVSLPPIRSSPRGSRDEECGPLPGISSIMGANLATSTMRNLTISADQSEQAFPTVRPGRRLSEATPRAFRSSPGREVGRQIEMDRTALQHHSPWASPRQTRLDSAGGTDLSLSRPSSPEAASTLSSSYSTIASGTSLSSILEDRRTCASPGPIQLPGFAQLNSTLPPLRSHSARSAFELSDLRTSLPSEESASRGSLTRAHLRSPRSTPLPLSRPMSPAVSTGGSPLIHPLTRRLRTLKVATDEDHIMEPMPNRDVPGQPELPGDIVPVKFEPNVTPPPRSPASKGISLEDLSNISWSASVTEREDMSCTPTRTVPEPWPQEASPETATATSPSTPIMRESPSPFASTLSPSTCESSPPTTESEEEDSKSGILKPDSESEETEAVGAGAKHRERLARRRANQVVFDPSKAQARSGPFMGFSHDMTYMMPPALSVAQLAQQAEQLGFKLQPNPARRPELEARIAQRRQKIEELQREEQADAAAIGLMSNTWNPDMTLGMMGMPEHAPAQPLHLGGFNSLPLGMLPQDAMDTSLTMPLLGPDPFLDYSSPSPSFQSEFSSYTGLPGLTAAPSPASSFSLASPPPMSLPSSITRMENFRASQLMEPIGKDEAGSSSTNPSGPGTHKCESCGKTFRRPSGLKDHMNIHSGEKPYCCPLETCRKGFATRSNMIRHHNKTHPTRAKIGGVADISADIDDGADLGLGAEGESSLASSTGSLTAIATTSASAGGGSSSQGRFRVVQQNMSKAAAIEAGVGPMRGTKERRAGRRQSTTTAQLI